MNITLVGTRSQVLGGYNCLRGYTSMVDLINVSEAKEYQRPIIEEHKDKIVKFYNNHKYLFFPEIILACEVENSYFIDEMQNNPPHSLDEKGITYRYLKSYNTCNLTIDTDLVKLHVIDGNHRLKAFEDSPFEETNKVPFCVLFLLKGQNDKDAKVIFNNINFKAEKLQQEENLKNIFNETCSGVFEDDEIEEDFGLEYLNTKKLLKHLNDANIVLLKKISENYREICFKLVKCLCPILEKEKTEKFKTKDNVILAIYKAMQNILPSLQGEKIELGLFIVSVYYQILDAENKEDRKYNLFLNWIKKNNIDKIKDICADDLIGIFNNILERKQRQIFVSMPFGEPTCNDIFGVIEDVVKKLAENNFINIPQVIRVDELQKSSTFKITEKIETAIENSGCLIAVLNFQNANVYHEIGYAMGYFKGKGLENSVLLALRVPKRDEELTNPEYKVGFNLQGYQQIRFKELKEFKKQLEEKLLLHFGL